MTSASSVRSREVFLFSYLWDIVDEGPDYFARRLVEDLGVTGVALAVAYHDGRFLLPHHSRRRMYVLEPHVTYFPCDLSLYDGTPLKPTLWSELGNGAGNAFTQTKAALDRAGLELLGWTVYCYNERMGTAYPEYAVENAWGSRYTFGLCPAQEAVRIYARALTEDVCRTTGARSLWLESLDYRDFDYCGAEAITKITADLDPVQRLLASLCFCPACLSVAALTGVDGEGVRVSARETFDQILQAPKPSAAPLAERLAEWPSVAAYVEARDAQVEVLHQEVAAIADRHGARCFPDVTTILSRDLQSAEAVRSQAKVVRAAHPDRLPCAMLRPDSTGGRTPGYWSEVARRYVEADVPTFFIYNYGLVEAPILDAIGAVLTGRT
ncbi:MAG: hypothetical protein CL878_07805 [Dehalococcoidia bacterium]|nr:hypothetical protein [Dehalococcoidia bacterium]